MYVEYAVRMSLFWIKLIALIAMVFDHVGLFLFPQLIELRLIGRLAFPLFAWAIANGIRHTSDKWRYVMRLSVFGILSQLPYWLVFYTAGYRDIAVNIFFTLLFGLFAVLMSDGSPNRVLKATVIGIFAVATWLLKFDYGAYGVLSIVIFYYCWGRIWRMFWGQVLLVVSFYTLPALWAISQSEEVSYGSFMLLGQIVSVCSLLLIRYYNGEQGFTIGRWFYWVYPVHLMIIWLLLFYL